MNTIALEARPRRLSGKQCRFLRRAGIMPANIYGAGMASIAVQVDARAAGNVIATTSRNTPVQLTIVGEGQPRPAFIWDVQRDPVTDEVLHIDFYHVAATRRMRATVPLVLQGVDPGLDKLDRRVVQLLAEVEVETLPLDLPTSITVDCAALKELDDEVRVRALPIGERVELLTDLDLVVAKVSAIVEVVEEEAPPTEEAAAAEPEVAGEAPEEGAEGEGEEKSDEK